MSLISPSQNISGERETWAVGLWDDGDKIITRKKQVQKYRGNLVQFSLF